MLWRCYRHSSMFAAVLCAATFDWTGLASSSGWPCGSPRLRVPDPAHLNSSNRLRHRRSAPSSPALYTSERQRFVTSSLCGSVQQEEAARVSSVLVFVFACGQPSAAASSSQPSRHAAALSTPSTAACSWRFSARRRLDGTGFASWSGWPCGSPRLRVPDPAHLNSSNRLRHRHPAPPTPALYASGRQRRLPAHGLRDIQRRCQRHRQQHVRGGSLRGDELDWAGFAS